MALAAAEEGNISVIATYDVHQLEPVGDTTCTLSISKDNADRADLLKRIFPRTFHLFARKRDSTLQDQVVMDDHLLYILASKDDKEAAERVWERFKKPIINQPDCEAFHLAYTRECARYHAMKMVASSTIIHTGATVIAGKYHKLHGHCIHKNHSYHIAEVQEDCIEVKSDFDNGQSLPLTTMTYNLAELIFDPPGASTVHAVQGRTVTGNLFVHQIRHHYVTKKWLYTAESRGIGPNHIQAVDDVHISKSDMTPEERIGWAKEKVSRYLSEDQSAGRVFDDEDMEVLVNALIEGASTNKGICGCCGHSFVWARYSELQPTLDRIINSLGHLPTNVIVTCLACNRHRGSKAKKKIKPLR
jgi:hypothetical protein